MHRCFTLSGQSSEKITIYTIGDLTIVNKGTTNGNKEYSWAQVLDAYKDNSYLMPLPAADRLLV